MPGEMAGREEEKELIMVGAARRGGAGMWLCCGVNPPFSRMGGGTKTVRTWRGRVGAWLGCTGQCSAGNTAPVRYLRQEGCHLSGRPRLLRGVAGRGQPGPQVPQGDRAGDDGEAGAVAGTG